MIGIRPVCLRIANEAISRWHEHHGPVLRFQWAYGAYCAGVLVGVCVVERPKSCTLATLGALEITRLATDRTPHVATRLLGRTTRDAVESGCRRLVSYTRIDEHGTCYRAAGWRPTARVLGREWSGSNKFGRWLPGMYESTTEVIDRVRWEAGPDSAPEFSELSHLGRRRAT